MHTHTHTVTTLLIPVSLSAAGVIVLPLMAWTDTRPPPLRTPSKRTKNEMIRVREGHMEGERVRDNTHVKR